MNIGGENSLNIYLYVNICKVRNLSQEIWIFKKVLQVWPPGKLKTEIIKKFLLRLGLESSAVLFFIFHSSLLQCNVLFSWKIKAMTNPQSLTLLL